MWIIFIIFVGGCLGQAGFADEVETIPTSDRCLEHGKAMSPEDLKGLKPSAAAFLQQVGDALLTGDKRACLVRNERGGPILTLDRSNQCDGMKWEIYFDGTDTSASMDILVDGQWVTCTRSYTHGPTQTDRFPNYRTYSFHQTLTRDNLMPYGAYDHVCIQAFQNLSGERRDKVRVLAHLFSHVRSEFDWKSGDLTPASRLVLQAIQNARGLCQHRR